MGKEVEDDDDGDGGEQPSSPFKHVAVPDQSDEVTWPDQPNDKDKDEDKDNDKDKYI